mmetsp:Transcript_10218/g.28917  ORF Transcript_10218/g.28917 Transcript_10218/m.28917 type:complete len:185 (+) Transcript_10218:60-614(+)
MPSLPVRRNQKRKGSLGLVTDSSMSSTSSTSSSASLAQVKKPTANGADDKNNNAGGTCCSNGTPCEIEGGSDAMETKQKTLIDTLSKACAYGDLDRLGELLKEKDYSLLSTPDAEGYYPLQWAALNNQVHCAKYLLEDSQCRKVSLVFIKGLLDGTDDGFSLACDGLSLSLSLSVLLCFAMGSM